MLSEDDARNLQGATVLDPSGQEVGTVSDVFVHTASNVPAWAVVDVDGASRLVPLDESKGHDGHLHVNHSRDVIASAPEAPTDVLPTSRELYEHFGIDDTDLRDDTGIPRNDKRDHPDVGTSRDPRSDAKADDATQGHPGGLPVGGDGGPTNDPSGGAQG